MKIRILIFLTAFLITGILAYKFWIAKAIAKIYLQQGEIVAFLDKNIPYRNFTGANAYTITNIYSEFTVSKNYKILLVGKWNINSVKPKNITIYLGLYNISSQRLLGIGYIADNCNEDLDFTSLTNVKYNNQKICLYKNCYSTGLYVYCNKTINNSNSYLFLIWIPNVVKNENIRVETIVYLR